MGAQWDRAHGISDHTVETDKGLVAGFQIRDAGVPLGYVWLERGRWSWRTEDKRAYGDRQSKAAAIDVLREIRALETGRAPRPITVVNDRPPVHPVSQRIPPARPMPPPRTAAPVTPAAPARKVEWGAGTDATALRNALGTALGKVRS